MKTVLSIFIVALTITYGVNAQNISKMAPKVVVIGIGEKNPTLNEGQFPNLSFYYTPELVPVNDEGETESAILTMTDLADIEYSGSPEFIKTIWNEKNMNKGFMLFDKEGVCYTQGYDILKQGGSIGARLCVDKSALSDHLKAVVTKEKLAKPSSKEISFKKSDFLVGHKLPEFMVVAIDGKEISILELTKGEPTLIVFFNLPANIDINEAKESGEGKTGKAWAKSMISGSSGASVSSLFIDLESQFFEYDAREK